MAHARSNLVTNAYLAKLAAARNAAQWDDIAGFIEPDFDEISEREEEHIASMKRTSRIESSLTNWSY